MKTFLLLLIAFTAIPVIDLALLLLVGSTIGGWNMVAIVLITGVAGAWLARHEGTEAWREVRRLLAAGQLPGLELVEALLILVAGVLLVTPGLLTDLTGFLLLWPACRKLAARGLARYFGRRFHPVTSTTWQSPGHASQTRCPEDEVIDVKATSETIDD